LHENINYDEEEKYKILSEMEKVVEDEDRKIYWKDNVLLSYHVWDDRKTKSLTLKAMNYEEMQKFTDQYKITRTFSEFISELKKCIVKDSPET
jgi:hypothetical protein